MFLIVTKRIIMKYLPIILVFISSTCRADDLASVLLPTAIGGAIGGAAGGKQGAMLGLGLGATTGIIANATNKDREYPSRHNEDCCSDAREYRREIKTLNKEIKALNKELNKKELTIDKLEAAIEKNNNKIDELEAEIQNIKKSNKAR